VQRAFSDLDDDGLLGEDKDYGAPLRHDAQGFERRVQHQSLDHGAPPEESPTS
jgi:hypothetical protein